MKPYPRSLCLARGLLVCAALLSAQLAAVPALAGDLVTVSGTVPDEASKAGVLARLRELYGMEHIVDQISVAPVSTPANWNAYVQKLISPELKQIHHGELKIDGSVVSLRGDVFDEAQRQKMANDIAGRLNPTYTVNMRLVVAPQPAEQQAEQAMLDHALANRIVEFESGKSALTPGGKAILDEMSLVLKQFRQRRVAVLGHTDNLGQRSANIALSQARADAVKLYLISQGIDGSLLSASGKGADHPVVSNASAAGRARNRRIEFRMAR